MWRCKLYAISSVLRTSIYQESKTRGAGGLLPEAPTICNTVLCYIYEIMKNNEQNRVKLAPGCAAVPPESDPFQSKADAIDLPVDRLVSCIGLLSSL